MNQTKTDSTFRIRTKLTGGMLRLSLALALAGTLAACEDVPPPAPRARPPVSEAPPAPPPPAMPPPPVAPPPAPVATPDVKPEATAKTEEDPKREGTLTATRKLLDEGEIDKALALAQLAVREMPKRSAAWNALGRAQLRGGKRKDAIESFSKAVELNPKNAFAQNNLGLALIYDKQYDKAVDALEEAVDLDAATSYMWNNLGMAYEQLDRLEDARDAYGKAAAMESGRARDSLTRLKGVESVVTAKAETEPKAVPGGPEGTTDTKTVTQ
jgi:predicted negative regulator of RcsB-dependent stress response